MTVQDATGLNRRSFLTGTAAATMLAPIAGANAVPAAGARPPLVIWAKVPYPAAPDWSCYGLFPLPMPHCTRLIGAMGDGQGNGDEAPTDPHALMAAAAAAGYAMARLPGRWDRSAISLIEAHASAGKPLLMILDLTAALPTGPAEGSPAFATATDDLVASLEAFVRTEPERISLVLADRLTGWVCLGADCPLAGLPQQGSKLR